MVLGRSPYTLLVDIWMNGDSGQERARRFEQMQRPEGIHLEIEERDGGGAIVRRLRGGVDDQIGAHFVEQGEHAFPVADIQRRMPVIRDLAAQIAPTPNRCRLPARRKSRDGCHPRHGPESLAGRNTGKPRSRSVHRSRLQVRSAYRFRAGASSHPSDGTLRVAESWSTPSVRMRREKPID